MYMLCPKWLYRMEYWPQIHVWSRGEQIHKRKISTLFVFVVLSISPHIFLYFPRNLCEGILTKCGLKIVIAFKMIVNYIKEIDKYTCLLIMSLEKSSVQCEFLMLPTVQHLLPVYNCFHCYLGTLQKFVFWRLEKRADLWNCVLPLMKKVWSSKTVKVRWIDLINTKYFQGIFKHVKAYFQLILRVLSTWIKGPYGPHFRIEHFSRIL